MTDAFDALAARCGIAGEYFDVWGKRQAVSSETRRALLAAMHVPVDDDPTATLRAIEDAEWRQHLQPVQVVPDNGTARVPFALPAAQAQQTWRWTLHPEGGQPHGAEFVPAQLPLLGNRVVDSVEYARFALDLPAVGATGYHRLELAAPTGKVAAMPLIVTPQCCYQPPAIGDDGRVWGPAVQLYGLRSRRNWGIGDYTDLRTLIDLAADAGAGVVGVNPLHAMFADDPAHYSPYSPSSRDFLNTLYLDVEAITEFTECEEARRFVADDRFQARLRALRTEELVDYAAVAAAKREVLELLHRHFRKRHLTPNSAHAQDFLHFRAERGESLERQARFDALQEHFRQQDEKIWGWPAWPAQYRDPAGTAVAKFAQTHAERIDFFCWLQWLAATQLAQAGQQSWRRGLGVGIYQDLALGASPGGAETWAWQDAFAANAYAGAPPDEFSPQGQDWGLPPFAPRRLREVAYAPLIEVLRANMRHAGALRIDHAMWLARVYWVPANRPATEGSYVSYPLDELLGILALESQRNRCLVIGEDLGTVPDGFRERLAASGILSYRPFLFERRDDGSFTPPDEYPRQSLVALSTHDLPTLCGLWQGTDLDTRATLGMFPSDAQREEQIVARAQDRARILMAIEREGLLPEGGSVHPVALPLLTPPYVRAVHTYLARTPAKLMIVQPEDVLGLTQQVNLPGSRDEQHPNWRRRLPLDLDDWHDDERFATLFAALRGERGSPVTPRGTQPEPTATARAAIIPRATYRLQFNREFTFAQATAIVSYLAELGISHVYASPYLKARPGSGHGYDIVDHTALNPEIGNAEDYERFVATLRAHGMGQIIDVVPNHMGVMGADNAWWLDVLENGPASSYSDFFDIDWEPPNPELRGKVLLSLLGDHYGVVLNRAELHLEFDAARGEFSLRYFQHRLPIDPASYPLIVGHRRERLGAVLGEKDERFIELQALLGAFSHLPTRLAADPELVAERRRDKEVHKHHLAALCGACADIAHHLAENIDEFNGRAHEPASFDLLHKLIQSQGYRLSYWRTASDEINYRRFFDINDLAALRMEESAVFDATHRFVLDLVAQGKADGLRIDHPDGLYDPRQYFARLQQHAGRDKTDAGAPLPLYLVIEKILAEHERLPAEWPIHGATGYRFANLANALFIDAGAERRLTRVYEGFIGAKVDFDMLVYQAKKLIMDTALASELNVLANRMARIAAATRDTCDFTLNGLRDALAEVVACFPVYRSYVASADLSADDRRHIEWAVAVAKKHSAAADITVFDFVRRVLTTDIALGRSDAFRAAVLACAMKFQQFSAPVMAKGLEDTAFYRYHRLTSLNDVGADPRRFGVSVAAYHAATRARAHSWPHNLLATSTHDSKRAEDVRARVNVLSEMPAEWKLMLKRWSRLNRSRKRDVDGVPVPSANDEYLLYQTLLGAWPAGDPQAVNLDQFCQRIERYMVKAVREAKVHSSWINPNIDYESALADFVAALLTPGHKNLFLTDFIPIARRLTGHGLVNCLGQTLLKLTAPGVPDIYQGCELWQFSLVDPDNRAPVDFAARRRLLAEVKGIAALPAAPLGAALGPLMADMSDGRIKLYLIFQALALRAQSPELFRDGNYLPLAVKGEFSGHVCAFARRHGSHAAIIAVPRLTAKLCGPAFSLPMDENIWRDTLIELPKQLARQCWRNVLTGAEHNPGVALRAGDMFSAFPVALLSGVSLR